MAGVFQPAALVMYGIREDAYRDAHETLGIGTMFAAGPVLFGLVSTLVGLLVSVGFLVLAWLNRRGATAARVVTWVLGSLTVCCTGSRLPFSTLSLVDAPESALATAVQRIVNERLPVWFDPVLLTLHLTVLLAVVAASVLLALPTSNAFFHRPRVVDEPLWPGMPYPTPETVVWPSPPDRGPHQ